MKSNLRVNGWFIGRSKAHVMVIALNVYFSTCGTAIAKPSAVEVPTTPQRNERPELGDSQLQRGECGPKDWIDGHAIARPVAGVRIQAVESAKDGGTISGASHGTTRLKAVSPCNVAGKGGAENHGRNGPEIIDYGIEHLLLLFIGGALLTGYVHWMCRDPYGGLKPNVLLSGAATAITGNSAPSHRVRSN